MHSVHLLSVVIPKDWQVFLVMDLLTSVDPLMGGVFQNSYGVSHQALLSKVFNINHVCVCHARVCVCVCFLYGQTKCLNNDVKVRK